MGTSFLAVFYENDKFPKLAENNANFPNLTGTISKVVHKNTLRYG